MVKCLMIGQAGIGKTKFLKKFPNSTLTNNQDTESSNINREYCKIKCLNENFRSKTQINSDSEYIDVEIENVDITLETCLIESDFIVNNRVIPSNQIINTSEFKIIILCFAMDDPISFELIKSKYEIDLKKNQSHRHNFILLGLKSDPKSSNINSTYKTRSCSINSNSSTSKLQSNKKRTNSETDLNPEIPVGLYKKFAKQLGSTGNFLQSTNYDDQLNLYNNQIDVQPDEVIKTKETLDSYDSFIKLVYKFNSSKQKPIKDENISSSLNVGKSKTSKLKRSLTTPISFINHHRNKRKNEIELKENDLISESKETNLNRTEENLTMKNSKTSENFTMKKKLSHFFIGIGTYLVTCGSSQSRKLANVKKLNDKSNKSSMLKNKDKSWLLLSSDISINTLENDEVFGN